MLNVNGGRGDAYLHEAFSMLGATSNRNVIPSNSVMRVNLGTVELHLMENKRFRAELTKPPV
jgi:hypothetical protein